MTASPRRWALEHGGLVILLALLARAWVLLEARDAPFWLVPTMDEIAYLQMSERVIEGLPPEFGAWYMTPGYAWFLAGLVQMGAGFAHIKLLQMLMGVVSAWLVFAVGRRAFDVRVGNLAGALWAVAPVALMHEILLLKPALTVLCALLGLWATLRPAAAVRWWVLAGVAFGAAVLLRAEMLVVGVGIAVAGWIALRRAATFAPRSIAGPLALLSTLTLAVAIPTAQNLASGGGFVPIAFGGGPNFYIGNHAQADGSYLPLRPDRSDALFEAADAVQIARDSTTGSLDAAGVSRYWWRQGWKWWMQEPGAALALTARKAVLVWSAWEGNDVLSLEQAARWVRPLGNVVVRPLVILPLALVSIVLLRDPRRRWPLLVFLLLSWASLVPFFVFERFRMPMLAVACVFAAAGIFGAVDAWRGGRRPQVAAAVLATIALTMLLAMPRVDRDEEVLRANIGGMLMQLGRWEEALVEFEAVRRSAPDAGRIEINIGTALDGLGRKEEALAAFGRALESLYAEARATGRPAVQEMGYCHEFAGDLERGLGRTDRARAHYEAILRMTPGQDRVRAKLRALGG